MTKVDKGRQGQIFYFLNILFLISGLKKLF